MFPDQFTSFQFSGYISWPWFCVFFYISAFIRAAFQQCYSSDVNFLASKTENCSSEIKCQCWEEFAAWITSTFTSSQWYLSSAVASSNFLWQPIWTYQVKHGEKKCFLIKNLKLEKKLEVGPFSMRNCKSKSWWCWKGYLIHSVPREVQLFMNEA